MVYQELIHRKTLCPLFVLWFQNKSVWGGGREEIWRSQRKTLRSKMIINKT